MDAEGIDLATKTNIKVASKVEDHELPMVLKRMLELTPIGRSDATCSIALTNGKEIGVHFKQVKDLVKPYIKFIPVEDKFGQLKGAESGNIKIFLHSKEMLRALAVGDPTNLFKRADNTETFDNNGQPLTQNKPFFSGKHGDYTLTYSGTDSLVNAWRFKIGVDKETSFSDVVKIPASGVGTIVMATLLPERASYNKGEEIDLFIITTADMSLDELKGYLK
jgi:hypothetical protein